MTLLFNISKNNFDFDIGILLCILFISKLNIFAIIDLIIFFASENLIRFNKSILSLLRIPGLNFDMKKNMDMFDERPILYNYSNLEDLKI